MLIAEGHSHHGQALEVGHGAQQGKIRSDALGTAHSCSASTVVTSHQVAKLSLDLGPNRTVVLLPLGALLPFSVALQRVFTRVDSNDTPFFRCRALVSQWAVGTVLAEAGSTHDVSAVDGSNRYELAGRTAHGLRFEVDVELALTEEALSSAFARTDPLGLGKSDPGVGNDFVVAGRRGDLIQDRSSGGEHGETDRRRPPRKSAAGVGYG